MKLKTFCFNGKHFRNTLGRYGHLAIITGIVYFLAMPLALLVLFRSTPQDIKGVLGSFFSWSSVYTYSIVTILVAFAHGLTLFNYLHQPRQVSFYHSQPVLRSTLLTHRLLAGVIYWLAAYVFSAIVTIIIAVVFGGAAYIPWGFLFTASGYLLLAYLCIFAITAAAGQLAGTTFSHAEITGFILLLPLAISLTFNTMMSEYLSTYVEGPLSQTLAKLSPLAHFLLSMTRSYSIGPDGGWLIYCGVLTLLAFGLSYWLYQRRPMEKAGQAVAYRWVGSFIRLTGGLLVGLLVSQFFAALSYHNDYVLITIGLIVGLILWNMICQVQIFRSSRAMFSGLKSMAIILCAAVLITGIMAGGFFGYDDYFPQADQLTAASIDLGLSEFSNQYSDYDYSDANNADHLILKDPQAVADILQIVAQARESAKEDVSDGSNLYYGSFTVSYWPKMGLPTSRRYSLVSVDKMRDAVDKLLNTPEYLSHHRIFSDALLKARGDWYALQTSAQDNDGQLVSPSLLKELFDVYRAELLEKGLSIQSPVAAEVRFSSDQPFYDRSQSLPVYRHFTKTLALLERAGLYLPLDSQAMIDHVDRIEIARYEDARSLEPLVITDRQQITAILKASVGGLTWNYSGRWSAKGDQPMDITVYSSDTAGNPWKKISFYSSTQEGIDDELMCSITLVEGETPDFLK